MVKYHSFLIYFFYSNNMLIVIQKGFPKFLADFRDGRRIFSIKEFPQFKNALANESVSAIDVNSEFSGQKPVIRMIKAVPLSPPATASVTKTP